MSLMYMYPVIIFSTENILIHINLKEQNILKAADKIWLTDRKQNELGKNNILSQIVRDSFYHIFFTMYFVNLNFPRKN